MRKPCSLRMYHKPDPRARGNLINTSLQGLSSPASPPPRTPIPQGLCPPAQGCEARATLGELRLETPTPTGLRPLRLVPSRNPVGVDLCRASLPRVARASRPSALGRKI